MKKRMIITLIMSFILGGILTGCSRQDVDTKFETQYCIDPSKIEYSYSEISSREFEELRLSKNVQKEELEQEAQKLAEELPKGLYDYLVNQYELDWKFEETNVVALDFSKVDSEYYYYTAMAYPEEHTIYINTCMIQNYVDYIYRMVHELVHCMMYYNEGNFDFVLKDEQGGHVGYYMSEAFTDIIASEYLEYLGEENPLDYFLNGSIYCYSVVTLQILEHSIPDARKLYLTNDMDRFHEEVNDLAGKCIVDGDEIDYAELMLYQADLCFYAGMNVAYASNEKEFNKYLNEFEAAFVGNYEIALAISDGLNTQEEQEVLAYITHLLELEGATGDKYMDHLSSALN